MTAQSEMAPQLSRRVSELIHEIFPPTEVASVSELIREFHWTLAPEINERIHLDILEICGGKLERVRDLVKLAKADWRDLIMEAEYKLKDGKIVQNARGKLRLAGK